jgi:hypothetical protein
MNDELRDTLDAAIGAFKDKLDARDLQRVKRVESSGRTSPGASFEARLSPSQAREQIVPVDPRPCDGLPDNVGSFTLVFSGITVCTDQFPFDPGDPNGTYVLSATGGCTWSGGVGLWFVQIAYEIGLVSGVPGWTIQIINSGPYLIYYAEALHLTDTFTTILTACAQEMPFGGASFAFGGSVTVSGPS